MPSECSRAQATRNAIVAVVAFVAMGVAGGGYLWWRSHSGATNTHPPQPAANGRALAASPTFSSDAKQLAPGVYLLGRLYPAVAYVIQTTDGLILLDTGMEADARTLISQLNELDLSLESLRMILLTHVHGDHSLGAERLKQLTGANVYAGRRDSVPLRQGGPREAFFSNYPNKTEPHPTTVDVLLDGGEVITLGDSRVHVIAAPGHTPGNICFLLEHDGKRFLFSGDAICSLLSGSEIGTYATYLPPRYLGDAGEYLETLRKLRELPMPYMVLPGHPNEERIAHSPLVSKKKWHGLLNETIQSMQVLVERHGADGRDFLDGHPKELLPGLHYLGDIHGLSMYALRTQAGILLFDAPGGNELVEFLGRRFAEIGWDLSTIAAVLLTTANDETTTGLSNLVEKTHCKVVSTRDAFNQLRQCCPSDTTFITPQKLMSENLITMSVFPIDGLSIGVLAYYVAWHGKTVVVSGSVPIDSFESVNRFAPFLRSPEGMTRYMHSLDSLADIRPNLWLRLRPIDGRNANVYDDEWEAVIEKSVRLITNALRSE